MEPQSVTKEQTQGSSTHTRRHMPCAYSSWYCGEEENDRWEQRRKAGSMTAKHERRWSEQENLIGNKWYYTAVEA